MMISDSAPLFSNRELRECAAMFERILSLVVAGSVVTAAHAPIAERLSDTLRTEAVVFTPRYPLWSDGMSKRRWLYLPPGTSIDKSDPDAWEFPRGTRAWKE